MYKLIIISKIIYENKIYIFFKVENEKYCLGLLICLFNGEDKC